MLEADGNGEGASITQRLLHDRLCVCVCACVCVRVCVRACARARVSVSVGNAIITHTRACLYLLEMRS